MTEMTEYVNLEISCHCQSQIRGFVNTQDVNAKRKRALLNVFTTAVNATKCA